MLCLDAIAKEDLVRDPTPIEVGTHNALVCEDRSVSFKPNLRHGTLVCCIVQLIQSVHLVGYVFVKK